jgi:iron complex outermembrane recepter protein
MSKNHKRTRLGNAILLALFSSAVAQAQQAQQATPDSGDQAAALGTIIVTAEKRSEDVQTVPMSVGVIDATQLENMHSTQLTDFAAYIPGFTVIDGGAPGAASLGIRGIAPLSAGSTVATYIDETPLGSSSNYGAASTEVLDLLPYDFQSVEVLRGPQGTLYGATALGGVLRYVTKAPDLDTASYRVGADVFDQASASDLGGGARLGFSAPLIPGQLAISASYARQDSPGYIDNVRTGEQDQNHYWQDAAHVTLLWKPSDDLSVKVSAIQSTSDTNSSSFVALDPVSLKPIYGDLTNDNYFPEPFRKSSDYYNAEVNWNLGWADFVSSTSYSENKTSSAQDASLIYGAAFPLFGLPAPGLSLFTADLQLYKTTQEFRLTSKDDGPVEWLVGAFYTNENSAQNQAASAQNLDYSSIAGLDPLAVVALPSTYKEYAGFGDVTVKFSNVFDVTGGLRFAHNEQTFSEITSGALTGLGNVSGASSEDVLTYSFSPRLHISQDSMMYLRIASGYQPGGPNIALPGVPPAVDSSTLTNFEVGLKTLQDSGRLMFDMAVFDIEWDKIQVGANNGVVSYLENGGTARSSGLEFSTLYSPVAGLHLGLNGAYTNAKLTEDVPAIGGLNGDYLPSIPKWAGSATADYSFPLSGDWNGRVGGGVRYVGDTSSALAHTAHPLPQQSYTALDLNADVSNAHWTVRLFVKNATDERVYLNLSTLANAATGEVAQVQGVPLQPRTFGVGFDYNF